jgi:hypothetical protein
MVPAWTETCWSVKCNLIYFNITIITKSASVGFNKEAVVSVLYTLKQSVIINCLYLRSIMPFMFISFLVCVHHLLFSVDKIKINNK